MTERRADAEGRNAHAIVGVRIGVAGQDTPSGEGGAAAAVEEERATRPRETGRRLKERLSGIRIGLG